MLILMTGFSRKELVLLFGLALVLFSIPLAMVLLKDNQIFKSQAKTPTSIKPVPQEQQTTSSLDDLKRMLQATKSASITPTPSGVVVSFGPTLSVKIQIEGRPPNKNAASRAFVGIAAGSPSDHPTYLLSFSIDFPDSGSFSGLSLAGLVTGSTYTAYVKGPAQIATASAFIINPRENVLNNNQPLFMKTGDLNEDNAIDKKDLEIIKQSMGSKAKSPKWNERADFNLDGIINNFDRAYIYKNMDQVGASGMWFSTPFSTASASLDIQSNTGGPTLSY